MPTHGELQAEPPEDGAPRDEDESSGGAVSQFTNGVSQNKKAQYMKAGEDLAKLAVIGSRAVAGTWGYLQNTVPYLFKGNPFASPF